MNKFHFVFDKTKKSINLRNKLIKKNKNYSPKKATHFIIAGGDGFMLTNLKKFYKFKKPFYGINCGSYGFLMNRHNSKNLIQKISKTKKTTINPLILTSVDKKNKIRKHISINEVSLFRQSRQAASINLRIKNKDIIKNLIGDGVLVSTPAGSTAYNLSVHGPILSLHSGKLAITPISPFRPRRWKGKIISDKSTVTIKNLNPNKRPIAAVADNVEIRNIKKIQVKVNKNIKIYLLYDKDRSLVKKIKIEQLRKNIK